jgi:hypothetical protein
MKEFAIGLPCEVIELGGVNLFSRPYQIHFRVHAESWDKAAELLRDAIQSAVNNESAKPR